MAPRVNLKVVHSMCDIIRKTEPLPPDQVAGLGESEAERQGRETFGMVLRSMALDYEELLLKTGG